MNAISTNRRWIVLSGIAAAMGLMWLGARSSGWQGSSELHTIMEVVATAVALIVGIVALVHYYARRANVYLLIGIGFFGAAFLDADHALVSSHWFTQIWPSPPASLLPWSWNASRMFLSLLMLLSWVAVEREEQFGEAGRISERAVYAIVALLTLASFMFFAFVPLPPAYFEHLPVGRPQEFVAAVCFVIALAGYLARGVWKRSALEYMLVLSLVVGVAIQAIFMPLSFRLFDAMFDVAHMLKIFSYGLVMIGLLISMYELLTRAERAGRELRSFSQAIAHSLDGINLTDLNGCITYANEASAALYGYAVDDMVGRHVDSLNAERGIAAREIIPAIQRHGGWIGEVQQMRADGEVFPALLSTSLIVDDDQVPFGMMGVVRDITPLKQAQQAVRHKDAELAHFLRLTTMGEMATAMAHEVNQPLGAAANYVGGCISLVEAGKVDVKDLLKPLGQLKSQITSAGEIIHRLKAFVSKTAANTILVDMNDLVLEVDVLLPRSNREGVRRRIDLHERLPQVNVDQVQIKQVLVNLLLNATEAVRDRSEPPREVTIRTSVEQDHPTVRVLDTGRGIPPDKIDAIFEPFYTTKFDGMGMGLSICRTIIENHGGRMWAENRPDGKGACVGFLLPPAGGTANNDPPRDGR